MLQTCLVFFFSFRFLERYKQNHFAIKCNHGGLVGRSGARRGNGSPCQFLRCYWIGVGSKSARFVFLSPSCSSRCRVRDISRVCLRCLHDGPWILPQRRPFGFSSIDAEVVAKPCLWLDFPRLLVVSSGSQSNASSATCSTLLDVHAVPFDYTGLGFRVSLLRPTTTELSLLRVFSVDGVCLSLGPN